MTHDEFIAEYKTIKQYIMKKSEKARREGLLALEDDLNQERIEQRDIFEYGLRFVIDGTEWRVIDNVLSNIIAQETDEDKRKLMNIEKDAVWSIQQGDNPRLLLAILNSHSNLSLKEDGAL
jgi:flagellar motor component MotA